MVHPTLAVAFSMIVAVLAFGRLLLGKPSTSPSPRYVQRSVGVVTAAEQIHWHVWSPEAFKLAQEQDKPILLDIGAVWCHWCHVMDQTTYADPEVVALVKEHFVPIKVDTDQRPDINVRYNQGGWPTTAFLAPTGELLSGFTYLPSEQMVHILRQVHEHWQGDVGNIKERLASLREERQRRREARRPGQRVRESHVGEVLAALRSAYDAEYGGFGLEPKFPQAEAVRLLLDQAALGQDEKLLDMARKTLDGMSGLYDEIHGGFYRYSVNRQWSVPHYEKMADVNAGAIENYLQLYQATGGEKCLEVVAGTIRYLRERLWQPERGYFGASQDADVGSHDPEVEYVTGEMYFELDAEGPAKYQEPHIDHTWYADANARLASALLRARAVTAEAEWGRLGREALDNTWDALHRTDGGMYHYLDGDGPRVYALLADQALMSRALLDAYEALGQPLHLERARQLGAFMLDALWDERSGGLYDRPQDEGAGLGALAERLKPFNENAAAALVLLRLHYLTGEDHYRRAAQRTLEYLAPEYSRMGIFAADYATAVDRFLRDPAHVVIVGDGDEEATQRLLGEAQSAYVPWKIVQLLEPPRDSGRIGELGFPAGDAATAYVCVGKTCTAVTRPDKLRATLAEQASCGD